MSYATIIKISCEENCRYAFAEYCENKAEYAFLYEEEDFTFVGLQRKCCEAHVKYVIENDLKENTMLISDIMFFKMIKRREDANIYNLASQVLKCWVEKRYDKFLGKVKFHKDYYTSYST